MLRFGSIFNESGGFYVVWAGKCLNALSVGFDNDIQMEWMTPGTFVILCYSLTRMFYSLMSVHLLLVSLCRSLKYS